MVRENADGRVVYNQPAGHVEVGESLQAAALRETFEETGWHVQLTQLLGIYQHTSADNGISYVRHCFIAEALEQDLNASLDPDIEAALWLSYEEILAQQAQLRSPMVLAAIQDLIDGIAYPLSLIHE
jgi:ADP-ribose pyrophosphatase YjhB (NUDIX family)